MKRFFLIFTALIALLGIGGSIIVSRIDPADVQKYVTEASLQLTGKTLLLADAPEISFFPLGVSFGKISWGLEQGKPAAHGLSASAEGGLIRLEMLPLLSGKVDIEEIRLDSPVITVNPASPADDAANAAANNPASAAPAQEPATISLELLRITNGTILCNTPDGSLHLTRVNAGIEGLRPNTPAKMRVDFALASTKPRFTGTVEAETLIQYNVASLTLDNTRLTVTQQSGDLPLQKPLHLEFNVKASPQAVHISKLRGTISTIACEGDVRLTLGDTPTVQGRISLGEVNVNALNAALQANASAKSNSKDAPPKNAAKTIYPTVDCILQIAALRYDGLALHNFYTHVQGTGGGKAQYTVNPLRFSLGSGGSFAGNVSLSLPDATWKSTGTAADINVSPLLEALKNKRSVEGMANAEYTLRGKGLSGTAINQSCSGEGKFEVRNIRLHGMSILPAGAPVNAGLPSQFSLLTVPFTAQNGLVTLPHIALHGEGLNATGNGQVRLPQESVNIALTVNTLGMSLPAKITGTYSNISYSLDEKRATDLLRQLPGLLQPASKQQTPQKSATPSRTSEKESTGAGEVVRGLGTGLRQIFGK